MFEITIIVIVIAAFAAKSTNPFLIARKLSAGLWFSKGATPKIIEVTTTLCKEARIAADAELAAQGKLHERTKEIYEKKGVLWSNQTLDPVIAESQARQARLKELAEKARAKAAK